MKSRAQKIYDAWEEEYCLQQGFYERRALAAAIRKIIDEFEYFRGDDGFGSMVISSRELYDLVQELETLQEPSQDPSPSGS
jgi:hypothetical protein